MNKSSIKGALVVLAVIGVTAFIQRNVFAVPVVGSYLPR